jgi:septum site-determining protein MinC
MVDSSRSKMQIKGIREGILITLGEGQWNDLMQVLLQQINEQINFFRGAHLVLDVGNQVLHAVDLGGLRDQLSEKEISLWGLLSNSTITEQTAKVLGLATRLNTYKPEKSIRPIDTNLTGQDGELIYRTIRSGFKLTSQRHVTIIGDVNPGAEIISSGNIVVWGRLKGVVHAGCEGDEKAVVCALDLTPARIGIAGFVAGSPLRKSKTMPELARIKNGQIQTEPWENKGK